jgi:hypothetical protein
VEEKPDIGGTTAVYEKVGLAWLPRFLRGRLTPAAMGSAITALCIAIWYVLNAQHDIRNAQRDIRQLHDTVGDLQRQSDLLHKIDTQLAVMGSKVDDIANEVDRQRAWREKIEGVAELPPHASSRHKHL